MLTSSNNQAGFTLIELLVTISILGIFLIPMIGYLSTTNQQIEELHKRTIAINLARLKLEEEINEDFDNVISSSLINFNGEFIAYKYQFNVIRINERIKKVQIKVYCHKREVVDLITFITASI
ncbi:type IV pilus modification PilV family protein [Orenia marismortui]|uniref:type IV pilus modification PilV family protein n=1 Tax=Orenia marismortui TaxID=46469 RepID=UPI0003685E63|nr:prepilin-type N-terminal cleavage/methylation domain-containing protein [Orenia marismortui]